MMEPLRNWREQRRLSLDDVGDLTGLHPSTISRVERGERRLRPEVKVRVARRLGARIRDLFVPQERGR
jgi:transcriptional regulator with XRE-family HTH domain